MQGSNRLAGGSRLVCSAGLILLLLALAPGSFADEAAKDAARTIRAKLPAPTPGVSIEFQGDVIIEDLWAGEVRVSLRLAKVGREYFWRIVEDSFLDWSGGEVREKLMVHAGADLGVVGGSYERSDRDGVVDIVFSRGEGGMALERRHRKGESSGESESLALKTADGALAGLGSVLAFLRVADPKKNAVYELPYLSSSAFGDPAAAEPAHATLAGRGPAKWSFGDKSFETSVVRFDTGGQVWDLHLSRDHKTLIAMESTTGPMKIVPSGLGGERVAVDPREPATTWKQAFLKFGFGYHMAREELLEEAFLWPTMYDYEVKTLKRWPADKPIEEFKKAWIAEFVAGSKHRDVPATRRLLSMTLATGKIQKETGTEVVFWAHPNFGGGTQRTYHLKKVDDHWGIWRIEF